MNRASVNPMLINCAAPAIGDYHGAINPGAQQAVLLITAA
jgi:hypothetical protein